jgi:hypothetical protein
VTWTAGRSSVTQRAGRTWWPASRRGRRQTGRRTSRACGRWRRPGLSGGPGRSPAGEGPSTIGSRVNVSASSGSAAYVTPSPSEDTDCAVLVLPAMVGRAERAAAGPGTLERGEGRICCRHHFLRTLDRRPRRRRGGLLLHRNTEQPVVLQPDRIRTRRTVAGERIQHRIRMTQPLAGPVTVDERVKPPSVLEKGFNYQNERWCFAPDDPLPWRRLRAAG